MTYADTYAAPVTGQAAAHLAGGATHGAPRALPLATDASGKVFRQGARCEVIAVHHPALQADLRKWIVVDRIHAAERVVWAHDDKPITYRTNRAGRRVIATDPRSIQTLYGMDELKVWI
ncbi:hypothetical protein ACU4GI_32990 [Cupriavidus basilensis]